jgi:5-methylcytosine-specific restriction endonuclease McrA
MLNHSVLVLNQNYEPLNICHVRRALTLLYQSKAEMLENGYGFIHTANREIPIPSVIRLPYLVKRPFHTVRKISRAEIFSRDQFTCQYCGKQTRQLTLDHVIPRYRGGQHTWENVVSACAACNRHKAGRTPEEANMKLHKIPAPPHAHRYSYIPTNYLKMREEWERYFPH